MKAGIDTAALDARLLLQAACNASHELIVAEPESAVSAAQAETYRALIMRRARHEPVSRILGTREFYGRSFLVTPAVLDPRPETETVIEEVLERFGDRGPFRFADLGTGSGAIAVTILCELKQAQGTATDVSTAALSIARVNAERHGVAERLEFVQTNWLNGLARSFDVIVSNPPYIPLVGIDALAPEVRDHDPRLALDGGPDGLEAYRRIAATAGAHLNASGHVIVEIGAGQEDKVVGIFEAQGFRRDRIRRDLLGLVRCLTFQRVAD